ncbi:hypothetical protein [Allorhizobium undicola]|uniref:hypothetical protein n=1 Tax=Allorhizobium undicola TaxID=78527 RepID=UPI0004898AC9|nr:hypothetical protein [Allorhizobium undicola]
MATTTVTDTSYSATLLRIHTLEQVIKAALEELAELKDQIGDGGGEPADLDRIYTITVGGSQSPASADPQAQTVYDVARTSLHSKVFGTSFDWMERLETNSVPPIVNLAFGGAPNEFYTSGRSTWSLTWSNGLGIYDAVAGSSRSLSSLCFGSGFGASNLISNNTSLYSRIVACESRLTAGGL